MKTRTAIVWLFVIAALYDGLLGLLFLVAAPAVFAYFQVTPPNHPAYVQFPALLLIVFGLMFAAVARNPRANRQLILYGMLLKVSYCGVVFAYWAMGNIPAMWRPFAVFDVAFLVLFGWAYINLAGQAEAA